MPLRVSIDLAALRRREEDEQLAPLVSLSNYIIRCRRQWSGRVLKLRSEDVHLLAETYGETPLQLGTHLLDARVLSGGPE